MMQTVIFDMDGVLVDTEPVHHLAYERQFQELQISVDEEIYASFTGNSTPNIFMKLKEMFGLSQSVDELTATKLKYFNEAFESHADLQLMPGVLPLIKNLHHNGIQLLIASSSAPNTIERVVNRFALQPYFSHLISGEEFPKSKPDPAIFLRAVALSKTPKENCLIVEDSTNGIKAARAAGVFCIGYANRGQNPQDISAANMKIDDFSELSFDRLQDLI
ncbi:MAG: HAD family phosphatase [Flavobacteriaceae bacterium]